MELTTAIILILLFCSIFVSFVLLHFLLEFRKHNSIIFFQEKPGCHIINNNSVSCLHSDSKIYGNIAMISLTDMVLSMIYFHNIRYYNGRNI